MRVLWGGQDIENNGCWFTISRSELLGQTGIRIGFRDVWDIGGVLKRDSVAELTGAINTQRAILAENGKDLLFIDNDGGLTGHGLLNSETLNGTRVIRGPSFPKPNTWGMSDEYAGFKRTFGFAVQGDVYSPEGNIMFYRDSVRQLSTGGPRIANVVSLQGLVQTQVLALQTPITIEQAGFAVGIHTRPSPPAPLYPGYLKERPFLLEYNTPQIFGNVRNVGFSTQWRYVMEGPPGSLALVPPPPIGSF